MPQCPSEGYPLMQALADLEDGDPPAAIEGLWACPCGGVYEDKDNKLTLVYLRPGSPAYEKENS